MATAEFLGPKAVSSTVRTTLLDPKQLQQILDDLTQAEATARSDISAGTSGALGILQGDPNRAQREAGISQINDQARRQAELPIRQAFLQKIQQDRPGDFQKLFKGPGGKSSASSLGRLVAELEQNPFDSRLTINEDGTASIQNGRATVTIQPNSTITEGLNDLPTQIQQIAAPGLAQFQQENQQLFQQGDAVDPFLRSNQQINLNALNQLSALSGIQGADGQVALSPQEIQARLEQTPGFQFRRDQGQQAVERAGSSRGLLESGAILKGLTEFGQGLASQEFGAEHARLAKLAGLTSNAGLAGAQQQQQLTLGQADLLSGQGSQLANISTGAANQRGNALLGGGKTTQTQSQLELLRKSTGVPVSSLI